MPTLITGKCERSCTYIPIIVLAAVFLLIAVRQIGAFNLKIWQIMLAGAMAVLVTGQVSPADALHAINIDVMLFLFGMFVVGEALVSSGYLSSITQRLFIHARNSDQIVLFVLFGMGILAALLMNDTLAVIGTPVVLGLAAGRRISPKLLLLTLAIAITTGSVMSPIGNPQNLLIAVNSGMASPFVTFGAFLVVPTLISLAAAYGILRWSYRQEFLLQEYENTPATPCDDRLVLLAKLSLAIVLVLAGVNVAASLLIGSMAVSLSLIAVCAALPVLLFSPKRFAILRTIDWCTLIFFAAMFVLMESVWQTGFFQSFIGGGMLASVPLLLGTSIILSQFISNVPFVALFQPLVLQAGSGTAQVMALAAGSTIPGNLTILGAASNVIIIQNAEKQGETISFFEFLKVGVPLTVIQAMIYWGWLALVH